MKRAILLSFLLMLSIQVLKAQSIFIKSGRNLTNYKVGSTSLVKFQNEIGQIYEFGYMSDQPDSSRIYYALSLGLEDYNASGSIASTNLIWETTYANFKGSGYFALFYNDKNGLSLKGGVSLATLIHGRQQINGTRYDLSKQDGFKGMFISPQIGLSYNLVINREMNLRLDYDYGYQFNLTNTTVQRLQFVNHSLSLGFSVNID